MVTLHDPSNPLALESAKADGSAVATIKTVITPGIIKRHRIFVNMILPSLSG